MNNFKLLPILVLVLLAQCAWDGRSVSGSVSLLSAPSGTPYTGLDTTLPTDDQTFTANGTISSSNASPYKKNTVTINSGVTVSFDTTNSYAAIFIWGNTITIHGTLSSDGEAANDEVGGRGGSGGGGGGHVCCGPGNGGNGDGSGSNGQTGSGGGGVGGNGYAVANTNYTSVFSGFGTGGTSGDGGTNDGTNDFGSGATGTDGAGAGAGGGGGDDEKGGGGGGGGGLIVIIANELTGSGTLQALGGDGVDRSALALGCGGGGGGGGGVIWVAARKYDGNLTVNVAGGTAGGGLYRNRNSRS